MKAIYKGLLVTVILLLLAVCLAPAALAAPASNVWVNGVQLTAAKPYWKNGSATASATEPAGGANAYFNVSDGTLTLNNAVINRAIAFMATNGLVCADGSLSLLLKGTSTLSWNSNSLQYLEGIITNGALSISGDGSVSIQILNTHAGGGVTAITTYGSLTVSSGSISSTLQAASTAHGLYAFGNVLFAGGEAVLVTRSSNTDGVAAIASEFRMTGGRLSVKAEGISATAGTVAIGLYCNTPVLAGGTASFTATGLAARQSGLQYRLDTVIHSGGTFTFVGGTSALLNDSVTTSIQYLLSDESLVFASKSADGSAQLRWISDADGILTSLLLVPTMSEFHYALFTVPIDEPQTGDVARTGLWTGMMGLSLLAVAGLETLRRRRQGFKRRPD